MEAVLEKNDLKVKNLHKYESPDLRRLKSERFIITMCRQGACNGPGNSVSINETREKE